MLENADPADPARVRIVAGDSLDVQVLPDTLYANDTL